MVGLPRIKGQAVRRDRLCGVYLGDLADLGRYVRRLLGVGGFDQEFFDAKYVVEDPFGYEGTPYDVLRQALVRYGVHRMRFRHLLEVGAGEGYLVSALRDVSERITLIDCSATALERARQRLGVPGDDLAGDALEALRTVPSGSCDGVLVAEMLYYASPNPLSGYGRALRDEVLRVLAPGGRLILLHPYGPLLHLAYRLAPGLRRVHWVHLRAFRGMEMIAYDRVA